MTWILFCKNIYDSFQISNFETHLVVCVLLYLRFLFNAKKNKSIIIAARFFGHLSIILMFSLTLAFICCDEQYRLARTDETVRQRFSKPSIKKPNGAREDSYENKDCHLGECSAQRFDTGNDRWKGGKWLSLYNARDFEPDEQALS